MEWLLRRNFWMVKMFGLLIVTALLANTATTLFALYVVSGRSELPPGDLETDEEPPVLARGASNLDRRGRQTQRSAETILGYNSFCPTCRPEQALGDPPPPGGPTGPTGPDDLSGAQRSTLPLVVAATMESDDPSLSMATLVDVQRGTGGLFGIGDMLDGTVEVVGVTSGMVHIRNGGRLEYIPFGAPPPTPVAKDPAAPPPKRKREPKSSSLPGAEEAIQCNAKGNCVVDRAFVESLIANPQQLVTQAAASPATTGDGSPGFKLRRVRRGSLPHLLGLRNGDVITEVGGTPLTLDALAGLFGKLRHASHIEVMVDRRGKTMARSLEIRS